MKGIRTVALIGALALALTACGGAEETASSDEPADLPAATCLAGTVDCDDTAQTDEPLFVDGEPQDGAEPGDVSGLVVGDGLTVGEALATDAVGTLAIGAFVVADADGAFLCDLLAESLPPQCGGGFIALDSLDGIDPDDLSEAQGVQWSDQPVTVFGEIVDGVFVTNPNVAG